MTAGDQSDRPSEANADQVNDLFDSLDLTRAVNTEEFRRFLDHISIAIVISKFIHGDQRICYANKAFEKLTGKQLENFCGRGWSILAAFTGDAEPSVTLHQALLKGENDFLGTFRSTEPTLVVEAFSSLIENDDGTENYRIVALIDITKRDRREREEYARQIRDKDTLLREVQHRVKNNLQLIVALIRLEERAERRGEKINLASLTGRIESLYLLYHALSVEAPNTEIDLGHYLSQIASAVMNTYAVGGIRLDIKVEHTPVSVNVALPTGLVVNELLTNAFKHAFAGRGNGVIIVECLRLDAETCRIVVADDGAGLPPGVLWPVPGKIGALIVQSLRESTQAEVDVETAPDKGMRVTLTVKHKLATRNQN
jgi:PAS domain S-box-containing protein